jgi:hypothetical protein
VVHEVGASVWLVEELQLIGLEAFVVGVEEVFFSFMDTTSIHHWIVFLGTQSMIC